MDSVISQQQLNMLLGGMRDSIPKKSVLEALERGGKLDVMEKNEAYHRILDIIKSSDPRAAATSILGYMQNMVSDKLTSVAQTIDVSHGEGAAADGKPTTGLGSPIFRRVG